MTDATPPAATPEAAPAVVPAAAPDAAPPAVAPAAAPAAPPATSWRDAITDKDHRAIADRYNSPADLAKAQYEATKALSTSLRVPTKDAKPEEWTAYRAKIGVPEKPDGYKFEGVAGREPTEADKAFQGVMAKAFHDSNLTAEQAQSLNKVYNDVVVQTFEAQKASDKAFAEKSMKALEAKWGEEFKANITFANDMVKEAFGQDLDAARQLTTSDGQYVFDHPIFIEAFAKFGRQMGRGTGLNGTNMTESESASATAELKTLDDEFYKAYHNGDRQRASEIDARRLAIRGKVHGNGSIVGANSRTV